MQETTANDPRAEYQGRLTARESELARARGRSAFFANARLVLFILAAASVVLLLRHDLYLWTLLPLAAFAALVIIHERVKREERRCACAIEFYLAGLRRTNNEWRTHPQNGARFRDPKHLYSDDLDLFGDGSLFQLLCTATTPMGEERLAAWLAAPAAPEEIRQRQEAVRELRDQLDLREEIHCLGSDTDGQIDMDALHRWTERTQPDNGFGLRLLAVALGILFVLSVAAWALDRTTLGPAVIVFVAEVIVLQFCRRRIHNAIRIAEDMSGHLNTLARLLDRIERLKLASPRIREIRARLLADGQLASDDICRLQRLVARHDYLLRNLLVVPVSLALMLPLHLALTMEEWRRRVGPRVSGWLLSAGEFEALAAFSAHAYEFPGHCFPEILDSGTVIEAVATGHPLLPLSACKLNDVALDGKPRLLLISGSNMSGKSTLLRTIGVNAVLAQAGAPVRAQRMRLSPLTVATGINVRDSLQEGQSHFYAEMARLRDVVAAAQNRPVLFLLDEIMHGTNSHDRRIGTEAVLRKLVALRAIGLVTTHDLALAEIAESLDDQARNMHFEYQLVDGKMAFDYQMRPGPVEKGNALAVMRSLGLEV